MSSLGTLEFAPMLITDLFTLHNGEGAPKTDDGAVPYVAASFQNNGIVGYVSDAKYPGGWLSFVKDGEGGAGTCFYQPAAFWPSNHVFALEPKHEDTTEPALIVLASLITHQCFPKYNRGFAANATRLSRQKIMVPISLNDEGEQVVDWAGLTQLGSELTYEAERRSTQVRKTDPDEDVSVPDLNFAPMLITDIVDTMQPAHQWFDFVRAKTGGAPEYPYVARSGGANAISAVLPHQGFDPPNPGNAITIGVSTSTVFYQPVAFYTGKEVQVLRHKELTEDSGLVLVTLIREQMSKFQWGNGASIDRLKATRIMVPTTTDDHGDQVVDWVGMDAYGRALRIRAERALDQASVRR